jgi:chromosome segregation ATPase
MKFPKVTGLVPEGEHFDESAIVNEGGFLSIAHLNAIENALVDTEGLEQANASIVELTNERDSAVQELATATDNLTTAQETITTRDARITELETQLAEFTADASGDGTVLHTTRDNANTLTETNSSSAATLKDDHPIVIEARNKVAAAKAKKSFKKNI